MTTHPAAATSPLPNKSCPEFPPNSKFIQNDMVAPGPTGSGDKMVFVIGDDDLYLRVDLDDPGMYRGIVARVMRIEWLDARTGPIGNNLTLLKWHRYCIARECEWQDWGNRK